MPPGSGNYQLLDLHGAGAQRSDPKSGDPSDYPYGHGPQGDVVRIYNYVRLVRDAGSGTGFIEINKTNAIEVFPNPAVENINIRIDDDGPTVVNIRIYDLMGHEVKVWNIENPMYSSVQYSVSDLPAGIYFIVVDSNQKIHTGKFIKQ